MIRSTKSNRPASTRLATTILLVSPVTKAWYLFTHLGPGWVFFRLRYALRRRIRTLRRRSSCVRWEQMACPEVLQSGWFEPWPREVGAGCVREAEDVLGGRFRLFSFHDVVAGFPPAWHRNQLTGEVVPSDRHWSELGDFAFGDIKGVWELSRFPWAFPLARAYARTRDERFAEGFWRLFEDWLQHNPPNSGPNWMCGQEATFRLMAATFAQAVFVRSPASTPVRVAAFSRFVGVTGQRIAANLDYALSQSNNHGISECVGLITAARLLPGCGSSRQWEARGMEGLQAQVEDLVYPDGGFSQHSVVYHRVLLHDLLWGTVLLRSSAASLSHRPTDTVPAWLIAAGRRATLYLEALVTSENGRAPLYGSNDGANVLPLADTEFLDFRAVVQAGYAVFFGSRRYEPGPWDETAEWLGATSSAGRRAASPEWAIPTLLSGQVPLAVQHFPDAGCAVLRNGATRLFLRCPTRFRHRPAQSDLLHVDIEWRGYSIASDAGSYSYNSVGPFVGALKEAAVHSTVTFDGEDPLTKVGRFLYLPWPAGCFRREGDAVVSEHDAWQSRGLRHVRRIEPVGKESFKVCDTVEGRGVHRVRIHWLLADYPYAWDAERSQLRLETPAGAFAMRCQTPDASVTLVRAAPGSPRGWWSPHYFQAAPAISVALEFPLNGSTEVVTTFEPA